VRHAISAPDFELKKTLNSGQVFHWIAADEEFYGLIGDVPVLIRQKDEILLVEAGNAATPGSPEIAPPLPEMVSQYFALDHPLTEICRSFPNDPAMNAAVDYCAGLRIIRQPKWECLATFICSSMKQVAHIRQMSHALRRRFGERREISGKEVYTFPTASRIAGLSEDQLRDCALGYRAKNLLVTAKMLASGKANLDEWQNLSDADLIKELCALPGVGPKVANCVMLFAYERLRAFPIDVWIDRVLRERYFSRKRRPTAAKLRAFTAEYFGQHGGYAQQYLFHHARTSSRKQLGNGGSEPRRQQ
jgi:N-glycosylase/DNA lyase